MEYQNNYEKTKKEMQRAFLNYDQDEIIKKFSLNADSRYLFFNLMGRSCRLERANGIVWCENPQTGGYHEADYNESMIVYDLLCYSKPEAKASGNYVNMKSFSRIYGGTTTIESNFYHQEEEYFDHTRELFCRALDRMGERIDENGGSSLWITVFKDLKMQVKFWYSDEEFPAELQFFWDKQVLNYMHYETVWYVNMTVIRYIREGMERIHPRPL